ncbi:MAG TPA: DUF6776 family protein [Rhodocyclaceae bacterium]|nr:DUF6776 family protein [Rhodocyclaceae bacterium]
MYRPYSNTRLALTLRRLRGRYGIAAPKMAVRTHVPWYWRASAVVVVLALALALAGWMYDAGRRFAGFDRSESEGEIKALREKTELLEAEATRLRSIANSSDSNLRIERTTLDQLTSQVKTLEEENARLKEGLAVFENLASGGGKTEPVSISRLRVEPDSMAGRYRYRLLLSRRGAEANQEFRGALQLYVTIQQGNGDGAMIILPRPGDPEAGKFAVLFRNFRSLEGHFEIPPDARIRRVEVRLVQEGTVKATQSITL